jgi:hypothetical protein
MSSECPHMDIPTDSQRRHGVKAPGALSAIPNGETLKAMVRAQYAARRAKACRESVSAARSSTSRDLPTAPRHDVESGNHNGAPSDRDDVAQDVMRDLAWSDATLTAAQHAALLEALMSIEAEELAEREAARWGALWQRQRQQEDEELEYYAALADPAHEAID